MTNKKLELEEKLLERVRAWHPDFSWEMTGEKCPKCLVSFLCGADREDYAYMPINSAGTYKTDVIHGITVDANSKRFFRILRLYVCPECSFQGYRILQVGDGFDKEEVRYGQDWNLMD